LENVWDKLLEGCDNSIFSTWEWLSTWWKHFGHDKKLVLLLAEENYEIVGIAPLMYSIHEILGLRQARVEFIGKPDTDYNDFILAKNIEECLGLFVKYLNGIPEKWGCINLTDIPPESKALPILSNMTKDLKPVHKCPYTSLPKSFDSYLTSLPRKHRKELNRNIRVIGREGFTISFVDYSDPQSIRDGMNVFYELHQKRWESRGFPGVFEDQRSRDFNLEIARIFSQNGWLGLYCLKLSDKPVAALYGFKYLSKYYAYLSGFDPKYSRYGVGGLLFMFSIKKCIEQGLNEFDFMRGAEEYKDRWNTLVRWNYEAIIPREGLLTNITNWFYKEYWHQAGRLKYVVKNAPRLLTKRD
jgi:CelD/BcsL family acetyltransferase involved in cellulose biosynthesis